MRKIDPGYFRLILLGAVLSMGIIGILGSGGGGGGGASKAGLSGGGTGGGAGEGGAGGSFSVDLANGTGAITLKKSGMVDTSFTIPTMDNYSTGDNPLVVDEDTTVVVVAAGAGPAAGVPYLEDAGTGNIYISDGDTDTEDEDPVTGIEVSAGQTLTFEHNSNTSYCGGISTDYAMIDVTGDIVNRGTITAVDTDATQRGSLDLSGDNYFGFTGSSIKTYGTGDGQNGGYIEINMSGEIYNKGKFLAYGAASGSGDGGIGGYIDLRSNGDFYNQGEVNASGGASETGSGGYGSYVALSANSDIYNSGAIRSYGGAGYINGGSGGGKGCAGGLSSYLSASPGGVVNAGNIDIHGGKGETGTGGHVSGLGLESENNGSLLISGTFNLRGGDADAVNQTAGDGGALSMTTAGATPGSIETSAKVDTSGGNASDDEASSGEGGWGGNISISVSGTVTDQNITIITPQVDTSGGDGGTGGPGGAVVLDYGGSAGAIMTMATDINTDGGNAQTSGNSGGNAGSVTIGSEEIYDVTIDGNISARGGDSFDSAVADAGVGGDVLIGNCCAVVGGDVTLNGTIDASGGNDKNGDDAGVGNNGGAVSFESYSGHFVNNGKVYNNGGNGDVAGGNGGSQSFSPGIGSSGTLTNNGTLASNGGNGGVDGGNGGFLHYYSPAGIVTNNGRIETNGGTGTSGTGGDGGYVCISGEKVNNGTIAYAGGGGATDGSDGGLGCP